MKKSWIGSMVAAVAAVMILLPLQADAGAEDWELGQLTGDNVNVREGPEIRDNVLGRLSTGDEVFVTGQEGKWTQVIYEEQEAYIFGQYVQSIERNRIDDGISIQVNGEKLVLEDGHPFSDRVPGGRRVYVPFRFINEAFGTDVTWDPDNYFVHVQDGDLDVRLEMFTRKTFINDEFVFLDARPKLVTYRDGEHTATRTMIPIRFFSEILEAEVEWDYDAQSVLISREIIEEPEVIEEPEEPEETEESEEAEGIKEDLPEETIETAELIGEVDVKNTLNLREGPSVSTDIIGKLNGGLIVEVKGFDRHWAAVKTASGEEGYVSSRYLKLEEDGSSFSELSVTDIESGEYRTTIDLVKRGSNINLSFDEHRNAFTIKGNHIRLEEAAGLQAEGLMSVTDQDGDILMDLEADYHYVIRENADRLQIDILTPGLEGKRVFIDAGHGDDDSGGVGNDLLEKDVVLDVSLYAEELLEAAGAEVIMSRTTDEFISLNDRFKMANREEADIYVSVHANAAYSSAAIGSETFWYHNYSPYGSERIAQLMQDAMLDHLGTFDRGVFGHRGFRVIANSIMPSTLIELGFLTNEEDADKLRQDIYRQRSADAILDALETYYK